MIQKLRVKFILINMTIVSAMLIVIFSLVVQFTKTDLEQKSTRAIQILLDQSSTPGFTMNRHARLPFFVVLLGENDNILNTWDGYYLSENEDLTEIVRMAASAGSNSGVLPDNSLRYGVRLTPWGKIIAFVDISSEVSTVRSLFKICCGLALLSFALFFGLSVLLSKWAVKPVETAWIQQRQFVADASHELKTPLTVILTNAELLTDPAYDAQQRIRSAESILVMSQQMRGLVDGLLELARTDNGTTSMQFAPINLSELAAEALLPFEPIYFERSLYLKSIIEESIYVSGSAGHLRQVLDILLDNASKYSDTGGTVTLTLWRQGGQCLLSLSSPGTQISNADLKNIFRRFYRLDKARAMDQSYGLGLAIADSIVAHHNGRIWAESAQGTNTFFVQLSVL